MKNLFIPLIDSISPNSGIENVSVFMDTFPKNHINYQPWPTFKTNCQTAFKIAHSGDAIYLKYEVQEDVVKVAMHKTNDPVHKDNCVEFFIAFGSEKEYYNIELNCMGICLVAYGDGRSKRSILPEELVEKIKTNILIKSASPNSLTNFEWELTIKIPIEVFEKSNLKSFTGQYAFGNFFKCGDSLPQPHFLSWNMIDANIPDFHLPEFFGAIEFG
jgi:hypothetical protein